MEFRLDRTIDILKQTPATLRAMLGELSAAWVTVDEGPDTWSPFDIIGHLIHGDETDWIPRLQIILERGETRPFTPFDRFAQFDRNRGKSLEELLNTFESLRTRNVEVLLRLELQHAQLELAGTHPELGRVTVRQLLATWAVHDLGHISQAARVLAKSYSGEVGPWRAYLPILGVNRRS